MAHGTNLGLLDDEGGHWTIKNIGSWHVMVSTFSLILI